MRVSRDERTDDDEREAAADSTGEEKHTTSNTVEEEDSRESEDLRGSPNMGVSPVRWRSTRISTVPRLLCCPPFAARRGCSERSREKTHAVGYAVDAGSEKGSRVRVETCFREFQTRSAPSGVV